MKVSLVFAFLFLAGASPLFAQQLGFESFASETNALRLRLDEQILRLIDDESAQAQSDVIEKKNVRVSGPLVRPLKAKKFSEVPKRILQLINPFARSEPKEGLENTRDLNPRAWSSMVGWHTGAPPFQDAISHEPTMTLISVSHADQ